MSGQTIEKIKTYIGLNQTESALFLLKKLAESNAVFANSILLVSSRYYFLKDSINTGTVSFEYASVTRNQIINALLSICDEIKDDFTVFDDMNIDKFHILSQFPNSGMVHMYLIDKKIITSCSNLISNYREINNKVDEANFFRRSENKDASIINKMKLPPVETSPSEYYWHDLFREAGLHGPKMLASLLYVVPDEQFALNVRESRFKFLEYLKTHEL